MVFPAVHPGRLTSQALPYLWPMPAAPRHWEERQSLLLLTWLQYDAPLSGIPQPTHADDARLVERSRMGDHGAFRQLFDTYSPLVYRIAYRMLGAPEDASDLTQDVFVRAYERLRSLKDGQAFHAWITRLTVNMAHDHARRRRVSTFSLDAPPPGHEDGSEWQVPDDAPGLETRTLRSELSARVQQALLALSADHRIVVVLHHLEGLPVEEIARVIGVPQGTIKSRLSRARAEMKRKLEGYLEE